MISGDDLRDHVDGPAAWRRLAVSVLLATIGGVGIWSSVVVLPAIEAEFGLDRGGASLPYFATMIGIAIGGTLIGRMTDRFGMMPLMIMGGVMLAGGYVLSAQVTHYWQFVLIQAVMIGALGASVSFGPLVADISLWFRRRRGIAVGLVASGNYLAGAVWPPVIEHLIEVVGWRQAHITIGLVCLVTMLPLSFALRRKAKAFGGGAQIDRAPAAAAENVGLSPGRLQALLVVAGLACCIAMSMPQVHMVAYCLDLGYGMARGAEMLSLMLGLGIVSRLASGWIADHIGGLRTLILGSIAQGLALLFYLPFDGLVSLYVVSALFGLSQGGIVPSYALIVRDYFPASEAGARVSLVLMATVVGMALGGWMSGEIYDLTGSYQAAFVNGIAWNLLNMSIAFFLLLGPRFLRLRTS
ncbi:MAG: MFS transporter [Alphaproteobacteria bacterium]|nr:MFS transporter [Alphaproteobacteria bacterium]